MTYSPYFTIEQAAAHFGVNPRTIRNWIRDDRLPAKKIGRNWRIHETDIARLGSIKETSVATIPFTKRLTDRCVVYERLAHTGGKVWDDWALLADPDLCQETFTTLAGKVKKAKEDLGIAETVWLVPADPQGASYACTWLQSILKWPLTNAISTIDGRGGMLRPNPFRIDRPVPPIVLVDSVLNSGRSAQQTYHVLRNTLAHGRSSVPELNILCLAVVYNNWGRRELPLSDSPIRDSKNGSKVTDRPMVTVVNLLAVDDVEGPLTIPSGLLIPLYDSSITVGPNPQPGSSSTSVGLNS